MNFASVGRGLAVACLVSLSAVAVAAPPQGTWSNASALTTARYYHEVVAANGWVYAISGETDGSWSPSVERAQIQASGTLGAWSATTPLPTARFAHAAAYSNGWIYVCGGGPSVETLSSCVRSQVQGDGSLGAWLGASAPVRPRYQHRMVAVGSYLYALAGSPLGGGIIASVERATVNSDGTLGAWQNVGDLPANRTLHAAATDGTHIYVIGGAVSGSSGRSVAYTTVATDGSLGPWTETSQLLRSHESVNAAGVIGGVLYVAGGGGSEVCRAGDVERAVIRTDGSLGAWSYTTPLAQPRFYSDGVTFGGRFYVVGGYSGVPTPSYLANVEVFTPNAACAPDEAGIGTCAVARDACVPPDPNPPTCTLDALIDVGARTGRVTDDVGIADMYLDGADNALLDAPFSAGATSVTFAVRLDDVLLDGGATLVASDAAGNQCSLAITLSAGDCGDADQNGDESDVDCGGRCGPCDAGDHCGDASDCASEVCTTGVCQAPRCDDGISNGDESSIDCGGTCAACGNGASCDDASDCASGVCTEGTCQARDGYASLVVIDGNVGARCANGGARVIAGLDDGAGALAGNGVLDYVTVAVGDGEIDSITYVCNGSNGSDGSDGEDGEDGEDGQDGTSGHDAVIVIDTQVGSGCAAFGNGGQRVRVGVDDGAGGGIADDGLLQDGEVDATTYVCNGHDGADGEDGSDGSDGSDGEDGQDGEDGSDGVNGTNGHDGLVQVDAQVGAQCQAYGGTGRRVRTGTDDGRGGGIADDSILQDGEVRDTAYICDGAAGVDGHAALITIDDQVGAACAASSGTGKRIRSGVDDGAGGGIADDGVLQAGEVDASAVICDGRDGEDGEDGTDGTDGVDGENGQDGVDGHDGADGHASLLVSDTEVGDQCPNGGTRVRSGIDDGEGTADDGVLDPSEVDQTLYICNGKDGEDGTDGTDGVDGEDGASSHQALIVVDDQVGDQCAGNGTAVHTGIDDGRGGGTADNGVLDGDEERDVQVQCSGAVVSAGGDGCSGGGLGASGLVALLTLVVLRRAKRYQPE